MSSPAAWMEKFPGLARLSPDLVAKLSADSSVVSLPEGTRIYGPGQAPENYLLLIEGSVRCWGDNSDGQLGDGTFTSRRRPEPVVGLPKVVAIGVGRDHACARTQAGQVFCWGSARRGAAGLGLPPVRTSPVAVAVGQ